MKELHPRSPPATNQNQIAVVKYLESNRVSFMLKEVIVCCHYSWESIYILRYL